MQSNLKDNKHVLTSDQWAHVKQRLDGKTVCPLYVKLLSSLARRWPSYKTLTDKDVPLTLDELVNIFLKDVENKYGVETIRKIATYLTCTNFGLREAEIVELLSNSEYEGPQMDTQLDNRKVEFSVIHWLDVKKELGVLLKMYYVDKRPYLYWSHKSIKNAIRSLYLPNIRDSRLCHTDLANAFHLGFLMEKDQKGSPLDESKSKRKDDWSDMLREIDELWCHLMLSGQSNDSVMLDWEVELLYCMTKQSVDVLSQDPSQLATEIINWLKPFLKQLAHPESPASGNHDDVPQSPHPPCEYPDSQHVIGCVRETQIEMYHLPSRNLVRTFSGHKNRITCLHLTLSGRWLISGSKDSEIIIWEKDTGTMTHKFSHHSSGVQCLTTIHSEALIISGSDSGVVVVSRLYTGQVIHKLENHRGVISSVAVNSGDDIFASASTDRCVCVWSLEDFCLLNTIHLSAPITHMDISWDSTFLLVACTDHSVHVRSLTTGSDVHCLYGHQAAVTSLCFARDNCRCAVGCKDGRIHLFDVHSAKMLNTLSGHTDPVTSMQAQDNDRFLITSGGNKVVVWNFFCKKEMFVPKSRSRKEDRHQEPVTCAAVSRDGSLAVSVMIMRKLTAGYSTGLTGSVSPELSGRTPSHQEAMAKRPPKSIRRFHVRKASTSE
ncbi:WD repeat-containing protein 55 homolog [Caerostris extrusa]|uniref:WD repeat-containing protein 55 homolog n=1 Tax=Caerostris extrusa TaxID=172846 RepID=A0AAV4WI23_CAEEX|nr:WD repeat-containing protein 55 homolog [Caerostris extrusa]